MFCRTKAAHGIARSRAPGGSRYLFPPLSKTQRLCLSCQRFSLTRLLVRCLASLVIFKSFVAQLGRPTSLPEGKNQDRWPMFLQIPAQEMHTIRQLLSSQPSISRRESSQMKTQVMEPEGVVELVPQVLNKKKILMPIDFSQKKKK